MQDRELVTKQDLDFLASLYDAEIDFNDQQLGRLVAHLKALNVWDETAFVITSDHGEEFMDHGSWSHGATLYQEQLLVPLVIKPPLSAGLSSRHIERAVSLLDVAPTLLDLLDVRPAKESFIGRSLLPLLFDSGPTEPPFVISELNKQGKRMCAVRSGPWKLIATLAPHKREEVYNLDDDYQERTNLVESIDPVILAKLRDAVRAHQGLVKNHGLLIEFYGDGTPTEIEGTIESSELLWDFNLIDGEKTEDQLLSGNGLSAEVNRLKLKLTLDGTDPRDAILLQVGNDDSIDFSILMNGLPMSPEHILLGGDGRHPDQSNFKVSLASDWLSSQDDSPFVPVSDGVWCRIVHHARAETKLDQEDVEAMRAVGYFGEE